MFVLIVIVVHWLAMQGGAYSLLMLATAHGCYELADLLIRNNADVAYINEVTPALIPRSFKRL